MIEEYARHNGHADLLRERIDGRVASSPTAQRRAAVVPPTPTPRQARCSRRLIGPIHRRDSLDFNKELWVRQAYYRYDADGGGVGTAHPLRRVECLPYVVALNRFRDVHLN